MHQPVGTVPRLRSGLHAHQGLGFWLSAVVALLLALPIRLPIPGLETLNILGQATAVASVALLLPPQLAADAVQRRRGSSLRLLVLLMIITGVISWGVVAIRRGVSGGAFLSLLNWAALGALVVCGQVLFGDERRLDQAMRIWAWVHSTLALMVVFYVLGRFGDEVFVSEDRGPFQIAVRDLLPAWPNYFALAMGVAICVLFAQVLANRAGPFTWFQLTALFAGLLISFSRSGWLVCLASLLVMSVASGKLRRAMPVFIVLGLIAILVSAQIPGIRYQIQASLTPGTSQSVTLVRRVAFVVEAVRIWWRDPVVGIGFARFDQYATLAELSRISAVGAQGVDTLGSVHNEYLSTLLKGGLITAVGFAAFLIGATRRLRRLSRDHEVPEGLRWLAVTGLGITSVLLIGGLGAESFRTLSSSAAYWILVGGLSTAPVGAPAMEKSTS